MSFRLGSRFAERTAQTVAVAEAALLVTWVVAPSAAVAVAAGGMPTKPTTALSLLLIGAVIGWPALPRRAVLAMLAVMGACAAEGVLSATLDQPLLTSYRLFPQSWQAVTPGGSGQMPVMSALCILLLTAALAVGASRRRRSTAFGLTAFSLAYVGLLGHLYGVSGLYTLQTSTSMAAPTAAAVLALAVGVVLRDDRLPVPHALRAQGTAGALLRSLVGWAVFVPPLAAWFVANAIGEGWVDPAFGLALLAVLFAAGGILLALVGARTAGRIDRARETAAADLEALNAVLSERVAAAVEEAEEGRDELGIVLDATPVGIFQVDPDGNLRYVNRRWRELSGLTADEAMAGAWSEAVHPADRDAAIAAWTECLRTGADYQVRYRYRRADDSVVWVDTSARAVHGADGRVSRWLGSVTDVTDQVAAARRLSESEIRYRSVVATMAEGVVLMDPNGRIVTVNEAACRALGVGEAELMSLESGDSRWSSLREDGSELPREEHPAAVAMRTGRPVHDVTLGVHRPDGSVAWLLVSAELLVDEESQGEGPLVKGVVTTFTDVTVARSAAAALRRSEEQFRSAMAHAPIGMALVELDGRFREVNRALARLVGYDETELVGLTFQQITHPDDLEADLDNLARLMDGSLDHYTMEKRYLTRAGEVVWILLAVSMARDDMDRPAYLIAQMQDVTDTRAAQERLAHRALHDPLTGLPNRDLLMDHLAHTLARSARSGTSTAVMFCDLDHFKAVNDTYGHEAGDLLLVSVADRLRSVMRPGDTVGRLGGDEFVVIAEAMSDAAVVRSLAERVRTALGEPFQLGAHLVRTGVSIGVAVAGAADDARSVLREADAAMYRAKALGRGRLELSATATEWEGTQRGTGPLAVVQEMRPRPA